MTKNIIKYILTMLGLVLIIPLNTGLASNITGEVTKNGKKVDNAVIYIDMGQNLAATDKYAVMNQKNLTFIPHVLPVQAGTTVDFINNDDVLHNVFSPDDCAGNFNLGSYPKGEHRSYTFNNPGCIATVLCNVHPEMEAYVVTVGTPYFTVSQGGNYKITDVPAGSYTIHLWHEKYGSTDLKVNIPDNQEIILNIGL